MVCAHSLQLARSYTSVYLSAVYRGWSLVTPHPPHTARLVITSPASQRLTRLISFALWRAQSDRLGRKQFHPLEKLNRKEMRVPFANELRKTEWKYLSQICYQTHAENEETHETKHGYGNQDYITSPNEVNANNSCDCIS
jgi:hypothetical protein